MQIPKHLLRQPARIERYIGETAIGNMYNNPVTVRIAIEPKLKVITNANGEEVIGNAQAIFHPTADPQVKDRVTYAGRKYTVIESTPICLTDENPHHYEVVLQ